MATKTTHAKTGNKRGSKLTTQERKKLPSSAFAFPKKRKEPLTDKRHVKNALARFDQVEGVSDTERKEAFKRIKKAANKEHLEVDESNWQQLGKRPHTKNTAHKKKR